MQDDIGGRAVFGFQTEAAAKAWIAEDRCTNVCVNQTQNPELGSSQSTVHDTSDTTR
jgi:hypothetical protein